MNDWKRPAGEGGFSSTGTWQRFTLRIDLSLLTSPVVRQPARRRLHVNRPLPITVSGKGTFDGPKNPLRRHPNNLSLNRRLSALSRSDANRFLDRKNEYPAIVDAPCSRLANNGSNGAPDTAVGNHDLKLELRQKFIEVLTAARGAAMIHMAPQHLYFADGYSFDAYFDQGFPNIIQLERLDDRLDLLHRQGIATLKSFNQGVSFVKSILRLGRSLRGVGVSCWQIDGLVADKGAGIVLKR
jgi:hypothetical protein